MTLRSFSQRARSLVVRTISEAAEPEVERLLVAGALIAREGEHYRIETGSPDWQELEAAAPHLHGACDCGAVLSLSDGRQRCRTCGREYRL
jgi:hypothetical protein